MRRISSVVVVVFLGCTVWGQTTRDARHVVPTGKGWGEVSPRVQPPRVINPPVIGAPKRAGNGIFYHGGPVMGGAVNLYFLWYGNFVTGPSPSDSLLTQDLLTALFSAGGLGGTAYAKINTTYSDKARAVSGDFALKQSMNDYYSRGKTLNDAAVVAVVSNAIASRALPKDANGIYFVLTSSDVNESSGFCVKYCGWHSSVKIANADIKVAFVGNPDRCPASCLEQLTSPNNDSGADGMASVIAHETQESMNDPDLNAWYDTAGNESADKCVWKFGPVTGILGNGAYNMTVAGHNWLIQMNWENSRGGGCAQRLGGAFYSQ